MTRRLIQTDAPGFVKDLGSGALLNTDGRALRTYRETRARRVEERKRILRMEQQLEQLTQLVEQMLSERQ